MNKAFPILIFFFALFTLACKSISSAPSMQKQHLWISYWDSVSERGGYTDAEGNIKIPARFMICPDVFNNIIAVVDSTGSYFLLKDGRRVGRDSVYLFDLTPDFESEGKIIYHDVKTDMVGFFDSTGKVVIPAVYNAANSFHNGVAVVYKNGRKKYAEDHEHWRLIDGKSVLINAKNEVVIDSLDKNKIEIDSPMVVTSAKYDSTLFISYIGKDGKTYAFLKTTQKPTIK